MHGKEARNVVDRKSFVQILGYSGISGPAGKLLSSLAKYGLVDKAGPGEIKISDSAMDIMFGEPDEKAKAIKEAANSPSLFAEINEKWPNRQPSDENLSNFLARNGFSPKVLSKVIAAYRDTMSLVSDESGVYDSQVSTSGSKEMETQQHIPSRVPPLAMMRVAVADDHLEVVAHLLDSQSVDRLIDVLNANKALLPATPPAETSDAGEEQAGE